jgi:hypothetical protein
MKKIISLLLGTVATGAAIFCAFLGWSLLKLALKTPDAGPLSFSGKQIDLMSETAKALIPTVTGFAVLAASGAGYLQQHAYTQFNKLRVGIYVVFASAIVSLACWTMLLGTMVDCSRPFDSASGKFVAELSANDAGWLQHTYIAGVILAKIGCVSFFFGIVVSLLVAVQALSERPRPEPGNA